MTARAISIPIAPRFWTQFWHWLRAFDEALNYDPTEAVNSRVKILEKRVADLEAQARAELGLEK